MVDEIKDRLTRYYALSSLVQIDSMIRVWENELQSLTYAVHKSLIVVINTIIYCIVTHETTLEIWEPGQENL